MGLISAVMVLIGLLVQRFVPAAPVDPVLAIVVAVVIVSSGMHLLRRSFEQLLDVSLPSSELVAIRACLERHRNRGLH
jgi:divalent metal cation (Fe/Co/Zn/Cd) transporter